MLRKFSVQEPSQWDPQGDTETVTASADTEVPTIKGGGAARVKHTPTAGAYQHYTIDRRPDGSLWELGRGGMGVTYKAIDANLHCPVALKIISPQCFGSELSKLRFIREARLAAQIRHPNVAAIHHLDQQDGEFFYSMEFVDGISARDWVRGRGPLPATLALDVAMQVARALTAADAFKVVHRDIKPGNIMIVPDPADSARVIVKVIDFGLARSAHLEEEGVTSLSGIGYAGTPHYSSPEHLENFELDIRADIYSLGCTLWFLLTGQPPFVGSVSRVVAEQLTARPDTKALPPLPPRAVALLCAMLEKDPAKRPQNPVDLHTEICACRNATIHHAASTSPRSVRPRASTALFALGAVAVAALLAALWINGPSAETPKVIPEAAVIAAAPAAVPAPEVAAPPPEVAAAEPAQTLSADAPTGPVPEPGTEPIPGIQELPDAPVAALPPIPSEPAETIPSAEATAAETAAGESTSTETWGLGPENFSLSSSSAPTTPVFDLQTPQAVALSLAGVAASGDASVSAKSAKEKPKAKVSSRKRSTQSRQSSPAERVGTTVKKFFRNIF